MRERAEVARAVLLLEAGQPEARQLLIEIDADEEEALVVGEIGIVTGLPLLDQLAFEEESFGFGLHLDGIKIGDEIDERADLGLVDGERPAALEIRRDAFLQAAGLADVNNPAEPILHEVHARFVRQVADLFFQRGFVALDHWEQEAWEDREGNVRGGET